MSPNDCELYLKGHIEVPNLLGRRMCHAESEGFSTLPGYSKFPPSYGEVSTRCQPDVIVPSEQPTIVGEGVTVTAPTQ